MPSLLAWVDFSDEERRYMHELLRNFRDRDIREELGLGPIRDSIADTMFPGTTTLQTRAKYMLFVPWMFMKREEKETTSARIKVLSRKDEVRLIYKLMDSQEKGIIGIRARERLSILPSYIYWTGLSTWGIRLFNGSIDQYFDSLDDFYKRRKQARIADAEGEEEENTFGNWDWKLVKETDFLERPSFSLSASEAGYLRNRIITNCAGSLLSFFIKRGKPIKAAEFVWDLTDKLSLSKDLYYLVNHARNFSEIMNGAALLYNHMLARKKNDKEHIEKYEAELENWNIKLRSRISYLKKWNLDEFWKAIRDCNKEKNRTIKESTENFVNKWINIALKRRPIRKLIKDGNALNLICEQEIHVKGALARLQNREMLENWSGESGAGQLDFRWRNAQVIIRDILQGLRGRA